MRVPGGRYIEARSDNRLYFRLARTSGTVFRFKRVRNLNHFPIFKNSDLCMSFHSFSNFFSFFGVCFSDRFRTHSNNDNLWDVLVSLHQKCFVPF